MSNFYKYLDPDFIYADPKTGLLRNLREIKDPNELLFVESSAVTKRLQELYDNPLKIKDSNSLLEIHHFLFQDVYEWAGKVRTVNISKDGKPFFSGERFNMGFKYIDNLIAEYIVLNKKHRKEIANKLAEILDTVNYLHPFREGNGRTQREFLRLLALDKGLTLNLNPPDNKDIYERYMQGTIESDLGVLSDLIFELIESAN